MSKFKNLLIKNDNLPPKCFFKDSRDGEIDLLIKNLNQIETPFFELKAKKLSPQWWDFVRYSIINNICIERGIYAPYESKNIYKKSIYRKIKSSIRMILEIIKFGCSIFILKFNNISKIYISSRNPNKLFEINKHTLIIGNKKSNNRNKFISKIVLDKLILLISGLLNCPKSVKKDISELDKLLKIRFNSQLDFKKIMIKKYLKSIAAIQVWEVLFLLLPTIKDIGYINDDNQKGLVFLANQKKIKTTEVQHAYMGKSHEGFSYPCLNFIPNTIPNETVLFFDSNDIVYPSKLINKSVYKTNKSTNKKEFDILIGSSPRKSNETRDLISLLSPYEFKLAIKLHPVESSDFFSYEKKSLSNKLALFSGEENFNNIASKSILYIPISHNSMSIFDSHKEGCLTLIYDPLGRKLTNMTDHINACYCYDKESLVPLIKFLIKYLRI